MKKISIIIPCYNEQDNILIIYNQLEKLRKKIDVDFDYIFVNDGSKDLTSSKIQEISSDIRVKLLDFSRNFGKEAAILAGLDYTTGDAAIVIDADLQMPVHYLNDMIKYWMEGYKLVLTYKKSRRVGLKSYLAKKYYHVYNKITNVEILPDALDFQLMDKEVVNIFVNFREKKRFFKGITGLVGFDYKSISVEIDDRVHGSSNFSSFKQLFSYAITSLAPNSTVPLIISIYIGFITAFIGVIFMGYTIFDVLINNNTGSGYGTIVSLLLFFFGMILIILGVIGYYIGMIYEEVKQRPNYIIKNTINTKLKKRR